MSRKKKANIGLPPGTVVFTGNRKVKEVQIHYTEFDQESSTHQNLSNRNLKLLYTPNDDKVQWYDIRGLHDVELIEQLGSSFKVHPLVLEDISDVFQRPKFELYENGCFIKLDALKFNIENKKIEKESIGIFLGKAFVLSFQEDETDLFHYVRTRISQGQGRIRKKDQDYLVYTLIDALVDNYFLVLEGLQEEVDKLEQEISEDAKEDTKYAVLTLKKEYLKIKKTIAPLREAISQMVKTDIDFISDETQMFFRDVYDHTIHISEMIDSGRDLLSGLQDLYISEVSFRMNKVVQLLTIVTTVFVPLSFLAGVYGMNFENIPELKHPSGYYIFWAFILSLVLSLVIVFKRKNWL